MADVGANSENPDALDYLRDIALPFAQAHGLKLTITQRVRRGKPLTLREYLMEDNRSITIPARLSSGAPGNRKCTVEFKVQVIARYIRKTYGVKQYTIGLGISMNEIGRVRSGPSIVGSATQELYYPLINLRKSLNDCVAIILAAGLPVPPKSSCYFCPYHRPAYWVELKEDRPDLFEKAVEIEKRLIEKRAGFSDAHNDAVYLHPALIPLELATGAQTNFFDELENCESGYCMV